MADVYDAVVIGGGHNGLVTGFYLARAGMRCVVLERRDILGGACNTEEFAPGYRASTGAYVLSMLRESIWRDMRLVRRGVVVDPAGPTLNIAPDGARFLLGDDMVANVEETKRFSPSDAAALVHFEDDLARLVRGVVPAFDWIAPDPAMRTGRDLREAARWGRLAFRQRRMLADLAFLFSTSATQYLSEYFSSPYVLARARVARDQRFGGRPVDAGDRVRAAARPRERGCRRRRAAVGVRPRRDGPRHRADGARLRGRPAARSARTPRSSGS